MNGSECSFELVVFEKKQKGQKIFLVVDVYTCITIPTPVNLDRIVVHVKMDPSFEGKHCI